MKRDATISEEFETGIVTISLDTELGWGRINSGGYGSIADTLDMGKQAITDLIHLFEQYDIPATWAVVGQLLREGRDSTEFVPTSLGGMPPDESPYWDRDWWHAPELIREIEISSPRHEIGSHSGSHCLFDGISSTEARADLSSLLDWAGKVLFERPVSHVFPQNSVGNLRTLRDLGFECFRGFPQSLGHNPLPTVFLPRRACGLVNIPGSVAYRPNKLPRNISYGTVSGLKTVLRSQIPLSAKAVALRVGVIRASRRRKVFHVVLHPKDFATGGQFLTQFESWLDYVSRKRDEGVIEVLTMSQVASRASFD